MHSRKGVGPAESETHHRACESLSPQTLMAASGPETSCLRRMSLWSDTAGSETSLPDLRCHLFESHWA